MTLFQNKISDEPVKRQINKRVKRTIGSTVMLKPSVSEKSDPELENNEIHGTTGSRKSSFDHKFTNNHTDNESDYKKVKSESTLAKTLAMPNITSHVISDINVNTLTSIKHEVNNLAKSDKSHTSLDLDSVRVNTTANRLFSDMTNLVPDPPLNEVSWQLNLNNGIVKSNPSFRPADEHENLNYEELW